MPGLDRTVATSYQELLALGYPAPDSALLREVELEQYDVWGRVQVVRVRALVTDAPDGGPPWALLEGSYRPVLAMGPELAMATECAESNARVERIRREIDTAHAALEDGAPAPAPLNELYDALAEAAGLCPMSDAWPILAARRDDEALPQDLRSLPPSTTVREFVGQSASLWIASLFENAITHHMQGQVGVALWNVRRIAHVLELGATGTIDLGDTELYWQVPALLQDLERRHVAVARALPTPIRGCPVAPTAVAGLLEALDEVDARQGGQPGGVSLSSAPYVEALIAAGEPALPSLVDCLEHDDRLTRSVHFWRDFAPSRTVMGVHEACYVAIANILDHDFFAAVATGDDLSSRGGGTRAQLGAAIRRYMADVGALTPAERRLAILRDDARDPLEWADAAGWIVSRVHPEHESTIGLGLGARGEPAMLGDGLRATRDSEVRRTLVSRATALGEQEWDATCEIAAAAVVWDAALTSELVPLGRACVRADDCPCLGFVVGAMSDRVPEAPRRLVEQLLEEGLGPWDALDTLRYGPYLEIEAFRVALGRRLLRESGEALVRWADWGDAVWLLFERRLPAAPRFARRLLATTTPVGRLSFGEHGAGIRSMDGRSWSSVEIAERFEGERTIRVRDYIAASLGPHLLVAFSWGWPDEQRDRAIQDISVALDAAWRLPAPPPERTIALWELAREEPAPSCGPTPAPSGPD